MSRSKAATAFADAALGFAQDKIGVTGSPRVSAEDSGIVHAFALAETMFHFVASCPLPLDDRARRKVVHVFEITIGDLIDHGVMGWLDEAIRRPFVLNCAAHLGATAFKAGKDGNLVTEPILDAAACSMVHAKQKQCPLKANQSPENQLGSCCETLVADLRCNLKEMDAPARR